MALSREEFETEIRKRLPSCVFNLVDTAGDSDHWLLEIYSYEFEGLSLVESHKRLNTLFYDLLSSVIHSVTFKVKKSPEDVNR